jgi:hypothetical protein
MSLVMNLLDLSELKLYSAHKPISCFIEEMYSQECSRLKLHHVSTCQFGGFLSNLYTDTYISPILAKYRLHI